MTDPNAEPLPHIALGYRYLPRVCAAPDCPLPPHVRWRVTHGGSLFGRYWRIGDPIDLCPKHERKVVDLYGADWDDSPNIPLQRTQGVGGNATGPGGAAS